MNERETLLDLKRSIENLLDQLDEQIILSDPKSDDEAYDFLLKKAINYRDTLTRIVARLNDL